MTYAVHLNDGISVAYSHITSLFMTGIAFVKYSDHLTYV